MRRNNPKRHLPMRKAEMAAALAWLGIPTTQARRLAGHWAAREGKGCGGKGMVDTVLALARRGVRMEKKSAALLIEADMLDGLVSLTAPLYMRLLKISEILPDHNDNELSIALTK